MKVITNISQDDNGKIQVATDVDWDKAEEGFRQLQAALRDEMAQIVSAPDIRDAYSPLAWADFCMQFRKVCDGMTAMRLTLEGKTAAEIQKLTGIGSMNVAAFKATNTKYQKQVSRALAVSKKRRDRDIEFLRSLGISVEDKGAK